ncbi:type IV pilus secretin PilQ [Marinicella rhabdoformis]|uniref:type IV pilus secretin PilQ n=1 Tax=Marinicella rhabdoformis TaxID=2580566 RepID=UPI0012AECD18|nr:type IV pilus secretin PilQ [Marinicella rhabdoformis]
MKGNIRSSKQYLKGKHYMKWCLLLCVFIGQAAAQSEIQDVNLKTGANGAVVIDFEFSGSAIEPEVFVTNVPSRVALDFSGTVNASGKRNLAIGIGVAKGLRMVSTDSKTRAVIDLISAGEHSVSVTGNTVSLTLSGNRASNTSKKATNSEVNLVDFRRGESGQGVVQLGFDSPNAIVNLTENSEKIMIEILGATLSESMDRKLDVIDFATPVSYVDARQSGSNVKVEIEANGLYDHMAYQTGNQYTLEITEKDVEAVDRSKLLDNEIEYTGNLVSFNFMDVEVRSVIQLIADASQLNIVVADNVQGSVTLRLQGVPWDQALDIVLQSKQLDKRRSGDVIWIAPASEIAQREQEALEALSKKEELEPLDNIFLQVNYAKAEELAALISGDVQGGGGSGGGENSFLSDRGSVTFDERTNTLLVSDVPDRLKVVQQLVDSLDRSVQQVQIESRIVVATEKFGDELGVRFGINGSHEDRYGNIISTGGSAAAVDRLNNAALINRYTSASGSGVPTVQPDYSELSNPIAGAPLGERLNINLPTAASSAGRWAASILAADFLLDLELSALETEDRGEVVSSPRVITANQTEAVIKQGVQIPYEQATSSGATSISFKDAVLALTVTPLITPDDRVDLTLKVDQDAIGEEISTSLGGSVPSIDTRSVQTRVLVENGQTVVLGGIYEQVRRTTRSKVPVLGDIPGLGNLFRNKAVQDNKAELLIFVTPTIIKESL